MNFSIVTPSFRNSRWLKLCIASVADQSGVQVEHIVQDSCSDDGTQDWLPQDKRVREQDETRAMAPRRVPMLRPVWIAHHGLRRLAAGHFSLKSMSYSIYTLKSPTQHVRFDVPNPTAIWWDRL